MPIRCVRYRQSGGFAGLVRSAELSGDDLAAADRRALERHIARARTAPPVADAGARDMLVHELEIDTESGCIRLAFDEAGPPDDLVDLVDRLADAARPDPP